MKFNVHMLAFEEPYKIRVVEVPDDEVAFDNDELLDLIYKYGQNDFQPQQCCSVSVGDVIELPYNELYFVMPFGFRFCTDKEFEEYKKLPRRDRSFHCYGLEGTVG